MAPVGPVDLLKAFKPLLTISGGIKSKNEVPRLSGLMKRFSRELVSKCTFCNILLASSEEVLDCFLELEGWGLINNWLKHAVNVSNSAFICEILELLDKCPVTIARLIKNSTPKIVNRLSKSEDEEISSRARKVVQKWQLLWGDGSKKKRKKEKSDDSSNGKSKKVARVKDPTIDEITTDTSASSEVFIDSSMPVSNLENDTKTRPKTAKVRLGRARSVGLAENSVLPSKKKKSEEKSIPSTSPGVNHPGKDSSKKVPPLRIKTILNKNDKTSSSSEATTEQVKSPSTTNTISNLSSSKAAPILKESGSFIEDIVNFSNPQPRKRKKSDPKSKHPPRDDHQNNEPSSEKREGRRSPENDEETISDENMEENGESNSARVASELLLSDAPHPDDLVIPSHDVSLEADAFNKNLKIKSILSSSRKSTQNSTGDRVKNRVKWQKEDKLKEVRFFELDETERINVSKQAVEGNPKLASIDIRNERNMRILLGGKAQNTIALITSPGQPRPDKVTNLMPWRLLPLDLPAGFPVIEHGTRSEEKRIQAEKARGIDIIFTPTTPEINPKEPDAVENPAPTEPKQIPLEDENNVVADYSNFYSQRAGESLPPRQPVPGYISTPLPVGYHNQPLVSQRPGVPNPISRYPGYVQQPSYGHSTQILPRPAAPHYGTTSYSPYNNPNMIPVPRGGHSGGPPGGHLMPPHPNSGTGSWPCRPFSTPQRPALCRYFLKSGTCRYMTRCNFYHPTQTVDSGGTPHQSAQN